MVCVHTVQDYRSRLRLIEGEAEGVFRIDVAFIGAIITADIRNIGSEQVIRVTRCRNDQSPGQCYFLS